MRKSRLFAIAATLIATGVGLWAASITNARVAPSTDHRIEPFQLMTHTKELPHVEFADYSFVFH
jgi:hypothetical protein